MSEKSGKTLVWLWLSAVVIALDLYTKHLASTLLDYAIPQPVLPSFNLTLLHNPGAAFSFLAAAGGWQRWFFVGLAGIISVILIRWLLSIKKDPWMSAAVALVLGGALGNLYDRITLGYVVDFIHLYWQDYHFPAFNIADSAITVGAGIMILDLLRGRKDDS